MSSPTQSLPGDNDDMEVVNISSEAEFSLHTTGARKNSQNSIPDISDGIDALAYTTGSGPPNQLSEQHAYLLKQEQIKKARLIKEFATDHNNPVNWMYKSFRHKKHGATNLQKGERAAIRIQAVFRGRHARNKFLYMYENKHVLWDLTTYLVFYALICVYVLFKKTSMDGWLMQSLLRDLILDEEFIPEHTQIYKNYGDIATKEEFWQYMEGPLKNGIFPPDCYEQVQQYKVEHAGDAGDATTTNFNDIFPCVGMIYTSDMLMGGVRLSQYRAKNSKEWSKESTCRAPSEMTTRLENIGCYPPWGRAIPENEQNFLTGTSVTRTVQQINAIRAYEGLETCFTTDRTQNLTHYPFSSQSGVKFKWFGLFSSDTYSPKHAYMCEMLYTDGHRFGDKLAALKEADWVDQSTRGVMVEFSVVNGNLGMVTSVRLFVEFLASGGVTTYFNFSTSWLFSLYPTHLVIMYWTVFTLLVFFAIYYLAEEIGEWNDQGGKKYCADITNVADVVNYILLLLVLFIDFVAQTEERKVLGTMGTAAEPNYVNYVGVNYINDMGNWLQSGNLVILTLKLFKYFKVSPKLNIMLLTIARAGSTMAYFLAIMLLTVLGFSFAFYCKWVWLFVVVFECQSSYHLFPCSICHLDQVPSMLN